MKAVLLIAALVFGRSAFAQTPATITNVWEISVPPIQDEVSSMREPNSPFKFGDRINGLRIGLWSESTKYVLNHRMNVWTEIQSEKAMERDAPILQESFLWLTTPERSVIKVKLDLFQTPDGPPRWVRAGGGISDLLHRVIREPGEYKLQWKIGRLESGIVALTVLPEVSEPSRIGEAGDTNLIAAGDWSELVRDSDGHANYALRGRLLVYEDRSTKAAGRALVYLELQNAFDGGWPLPVEVFCSIGRGGDLHFKMSDELGRSVPQEPIRPGGLVPLPYHVVLPCDGTIRFRADLYPSNLVPKPDGLIFLFGNGCWVTRPDPVNDFFLSVEFTSPKQHPTPFQYHVWQGTLVLPKVKIAARKP